METPVLKQLGKIGLIPVIALEQAEDAVPLAHALVAGGIGCAEITFRTTATTEAIRRIADAVPDMLLGAGTVLHVQQAEAALKAGARFIVAPGFDTAIVDFCLEHAVEVLPGVVTPTEINMALAQKLTTLKFFPAEDIGGARLLTALYAPYPEVRFVPTGGIGLNLLATYLTLPNVVACGGSWLATRKMIAAGQFAEITQLASEARAHIDLIRQTKEEGR
jgi:2-dehydro-3-deoxyphosphogluconate aldolase/(4S)-4-hydroxy-2-oxoglutarate aldolase